MTKQELFTYIQQIKFPYWELFLVDGYKPNRLRNYKCEDIDDDAKPEDKLNASLNALELTLSTFRPTDKFRILLKNSETANGSGVYGPLEFINSSLNDSGPQVITQPQSQLSGFGALPDFNQLRALGYVPESELEAKIANANLEQEKKLWELEKKLKDEAAEKEHKKKIAELNKEIELTRKVREDASSSVNKLVEVVKLAAPPILGRLLGIDISQLSGPSDEGKEIEVKDAKYQEVEKLATELYDSTASLDDIIRLRNELKAVNYELHKEE